MDQEDNNNVTSVQFGDKPLTVEQALISAQEVDFNRCIVFGVDEEGHYRLVTGGEISYAAINWYADVLKNLVLGMEME